MPVTHLSQIVEEACRLGPVKVSVAAADDVHTLEAIKLGTEAGLISQAYLIGDVGRIVAAAGSLGLDLSSHQVVEAADDETASRLATEQAYGGDAALVMKGSLPTACLLRTVLAAERARPMEGQVKHLLSHVAVIEVPTYHKLLLVTDAGMVIAPTLEEKVQMIENAWKVAKALGLVEPKVAVIAAVETVNPKMPATVEARQLKEMAQAGRFPGLVVDGPLALDIALSAESARYKGVESPVAGDTDIFLVPTIEVGNVLGKALLYLAHGKMAGIVAGASVPIPLTSRSETAEGKLHSIALAILYTRVTRPGA
ncbi:MAG: bifunctional enoyl-CoA hydratase/phosphate acetyltransferase [Bacillota bacterium]|nr:bifunctional enoyl-CoA hydratase/phosphate acetyltransferase [Bacillota bacterium]